MMTLPLTMRPTCQAQRETAAWFLPGADPAVWIEELVLWQQPLQQLKLYPLPKSQSDPTACGVLAVSPASPVGKTPWRAIAYGVVAGRIYLPVNAVLQPAVEERELSSLLAADLEACVLHPTLGLTGFSEHQSLRASDLLQPPPRGDARWSRARPGVAFNRHLRLVTLADPPSLQAVINAGKDDIGSQTQSLAQLPPAPGEPSSHPLAQAGRGATQGFAKALLWLTNLVPGSAASPTWIDSVRQWAASQLSAAAQVSQQIRDKELRRLMDLLERDPDEGLRYAMPLESSGYRGIAPPSNYLGRHATDFSLSHLGGGRSADPWHLEWELHQRLRETYRELANREIRLGRYRRAAYIFAELLNDLDAAAQTLMDGGHYHEAAAVFREKMNRPQEAADCLEQGGLFAEAIAIYEQLERYEKVGDLHARLDQREEAQTAYRRAANHHAASGDLLAASRILDTKMQLPDEAIGMLQSAWPDSPQARQCLIELFGHLGRLGRHTAASGRISALCEADFPPRQTPVLAAVLCDIAASYPDETVRATASDSCRVRVGRRLPQAPFHEQRQLLNAVEALAAEDRLLQRDCDRFARRLQESASAWQALSPPGSSATIPAHTIFRLPDGVEWVTVVPAGRTFYAAGYRNTELIVIRGNWHGHIQQPTGKPWRVPGSACLQKRPVPLAPQPDGVGDVWVHSLTLGAVEPRVFGPTSAIADQSRLTLPPLDAQHVRTLARTASGGGRIVSFVSDGHLMYTYADDGSLIDSRYITLPRDEDWLATPATPKIHTRDEAIYISMGTSLLQITGAASEYRITFDLPITSLSGTAPHTRPRLVLTFPEGAVVVWPHTFDLGQQQPLATDLVKPLACFTKAGSLVVASAEVCEVYDTNDQKVQRIKATRDYRGHPLAVMPAGHPNDFAICTGEGEMRVYRVK